MPDLKLARLPDRVPVKLAVFVSPQLHCDLTRYTEMYRKAYNHDEAIADLVPAMLSRFWRATANSRAPGRAAARNREMARANLKDGSAGIGPITVRMPTAVAMLG